MKEEPDENFAVGEKINVWFLLIFLAGSVAGTWLWSWKAIPIVLLITLGLARLYDMIASSTYLKRGQQKSGRSNEL